MAENIETSSFNFGIENTMEMGLGNAELLNDLLGSETSTASPEEIEEIKEEKPKAKSSPAKEELPKEEPKKSIEDFLGTTEDEEEEEEKPKKIETEEAVKEDNTFSALSNDLLKLGVFSTEDGEEETPITNAEEFLERFKKEKQKGAIEVVNNFIGQFGEDYQQAFDAIYVKGVNPQEYFSTYNNITNFAELDLTKEINQEKVLRTALQDQGFEQEDINSEIERLKNYGDLESVAQKHHKVLIKKEAAKLQDLQKQNEIKLQQQQAYKNQYVQNVQTTIQDKLKTKDFDGIPINPKLASELQDFLITEKYKTPTGELLTDFDKTILDLKKPENHTTKVKIALLLKTLEKDPTLSTIQKKGLSTQSNALFQDLAKQQSTKKTPTTGSPVSWFK